MDCHEARQLVDELLHECAPSEPRASARALQDHPELETHLSGCAKCKAEWNELTQTRNLLARLATETPTDQEKKSMWNAIAATAQMDVSAIARAWFHPWIRHFAAACIAFGAILATAYLLGQQKYGDQFRRRVAVSESEATSALLWNADADYPDGWGTPAHPDQHELKVYRDESKGVVYIEGHESSDVGAYEWGGESGVVAEDRSGKAYTGADVKRTQEQRVVREVRERQRRSAPTPSSTTFAAPGYVVHADAASGTSSSSEELEEDEGRTFEKIHAGFRWDGQDAAGSASGEAQETGSRGEQIRWQPVDATANVISTRDDSAASENFDFSEYDQIAYGYQVPGSGEPEETATSTLESLSTQIHYASVTDELRDTLSEMFARHSPVADVTPTPNSSTVVAGSPLLFDDADKLTATMSQATASGGGPSAGEETSQQLQRRQVQTKIIKNGELTVEVDIYTDAIQRVEQIVGQHGGFLADINTEEQAGGALRGRVVIRCVPEQFEVLFAALKTLGRVESENAKAADVTAEYVDVEARIHSLRIAEQRLQELISSKSFVDKMSSLLEVEQEMTRVRSQIEQHQGRLRVMQDRIAMSTITMTLHEPARTVPSASLTIEVSQLDHASDALGEVLAMLDGRLASGKSSKRSDGSLKGEYWIHISLAAFDDLLNAIEELGRVDDRQVRDRRMGDAAKPWAKKVLCNVSVVLQEKSYQRPSGWMTIEVESVETATGRLESALAESGASIVSNETSQKDDGTSVAQLQLRVPAGRFGVMVDSLAPLGRTSGKNIVGDVGSIIGGAADMLCDLSLTLSERPRQVPSGMIAIEVADFRAAREQLSGVIGTKGAHVLGSSSDQRADGTWRGAFQLGVKAGEMEEFVSRVESLGRVASRQITGLGLGDLSQADPDALGSIGLTLAEKSTIRPSPDRTGLSLRSRLRDGIGGLYNSLGLIAYGVMVIAPWLIIVVGLAWLVTRSRRKRSAGA